MTLVSASTVDTERAASLDSYRDRSKKVEERVPRNGCNLANIAWSNVAWSNSTVKLNTVVIGSATISLFVITRGKC